ncbi:MAG: adenylate kinase family protein [Candidatus Odinarchaeia archaeon]
MCKKVDVCVIVISGSPGTGKTIISKKVSEKLGIPHINLTETALREKFIVEEDKSRSTKIVDEEALINYLKRKIKGVKGKIIIEGHYADIVPKMFVECCIVIRTEPRVLEKRLKNRGYHMEKIKENIQAEILGVCVNDCINAYGKNNVYEIDNSTKQLDDVIEEVIEIIEMKTKKYLVGKINWLATLSDDILKKYVYD